MYAPVLGHWVEIVHVVPSLSGVGLLCIDCEEGGLLDKPGLDLLEPGQVCHEGGSGAGAEVDNQWQSYSGHTQHPDSLTRLGVMEQGVWGWSTEGSFLVQILK